MKTIMKSEEIERTLLRMAHQILEGLGGLERVGLVGIQSGGAILARRLAYIFKKIEKKEVPVGVLDIAFYRDDVTRRPEPPKVKRTDIPFDVEDKRIVLVDDVLFTGRSIRAAMDALMDMGRPERIALAVLVDRGGRELPICPDFVGKTFEVSPEERIEVMIKEKPSRTDKVVVVRQDR
ncbi:MAG: bifunctional pyr operon transcriptional regulator/uracil phosphoribosyltransferase PyrR [Nitrospirae bacterium]|nr:MAG: bifunctional pyr operon transcriptional regulator/uracil phosphoribosyltransferase PyrR [Nitrospirota bacterium]